MPPSAVEVKPLPAKERRERNHKIALNAVRAGMAILLTHDCPDDLKKDRTPLWFGWQHLDVELSNTDKMAWVQKQGYSENFGSTRDEKTLKRLLDRFPDALPAACAGLNGLIVIDADTKKNGVEKVEAWLSERDYILPPNTPITRTQRGGRHYIFQDVGDHGNEAGDLAALGCDVRGHGGYFMLPGVVRSNGARYVDTTDGLLSSFGQGTIPHIPHFLREAIESRSGAATSTVDAELAPIITEIREADLDAEPRFEASSLIAGDKGGDRSAWRLALANRLREQHRDASVADYIVLLLANGDRAGTYVADDRPGEGEFSERNVARDWLQAGKLLAERDAKQARSLKASEAFGAVLDSPLGEALADLRADVEAGREASGEGVLAALREAGSRDVSAIELALAALGDPLGEREDGEILDAIEVAALKAVERSERKDDTSGGTSEPPAHYLEARERKEATKAPKVERLISLEVPHDRIEYPSWTIVGLLPDRGVGFLNGQSQTGKSFAAVALMCSIAQGSSFLGDKVLEPRSCLYICAEDAEDAPMRCRAWADRNGTFNDRVRLMERPPNLFSDAKAVDRVCAAVALLEAETGLKCALVTIDTVPRACPGMRENESADVNVLIDVLQRISDRAKVAVLGIRHPKKGDTTAEGRGSQAFYDGARFEYRLAGAGNLGRSMFQVTKLKTGRTDLRGRPVRLDVVEVGTKAQGVSVTTCVFGLDDRTGVMGDVSTEDLSDDRKVLVAACQMAVQAADGLSVSAGAVLTEARRLDPHLARVADGTLGKALRRFAGEDRSPIEQVGRRYRLRQATDFTVADAPEEAEIDA